MMVGVDILDTRDHIANMNKIEIFGKEIPLRTHYCHLFGKENRPVEEPYVNLYVRSKFCNSKCQFCTFADDASHWNEKRFIEVLKEITSKVKIRKIAFTGGEPTLYWDKFKSAVLITKEMMQPETHLSMNTDGFRLRQLFEDPISDLFTYIQISRHHFDDKLNDEIFQTKTPTGEELKWAQSTCENKFKIQLSCNLIKRYIDEKEKMYQYLEWVNSLEINSVGFVSLMPVNQYSKDHYIGYNMRDLINERFNVTKEWSYKDSCECTNYIYIPENMREMIRVYHKNTYRPFDINETIIFDGENVKLGFEGEIIA
jgi:molybdenum cofactor biosynthesis enzyme MoaA